MPERWYGLLRERIQTMRGTRDGNIIEDEEILKALMAREESAHGVTMEETDLTNALDELLKPTDPPKEAARENTPEGANVNAPESILPRLPPEGQAWFNGLNPFCRWAVEYDLRTAPDSFVQHWETLRDTLQKLEREFGPSDEWK